MGPSFPSNIPWSSVVEWCDFHEYTGEDALFMDQCFRAMDEEFIADHVRRVERASKR